MKDLFKIIKYKIDSTLEMHRKARAEAHLRQDILDYYAKTPSEDIEIEKAIGYLCNHSLTVFPAPFIEKYNKKEIQVLTDSNNGLQYVVHEGKRLYFKRSYTTEHIRIIYNSLLVEQDPASPHCYQREGFSVHANDILMDVGSAEGIFTLTHIEKLRHAILFEMDKEWVEALNATFHPWKDKVSIIRKYVSNLNNEENISIDGYMMQTDLVPNFIKIDVEGAEHSVLEGMSHLLKQSELKIAICSYHRDGDFQLLSNYLKKEGFTIQSSNGVMLFVNQPTPLQPPYFRKGMIRAMK